MSTVRGAAVLMQSQPPLWVTEHSKCSLDICRGWQVRKAANPKCIPEETPTSHRATASPKQ